MPGIREVVCAIGGVVRAIRVRGIACACIWHQDFGRQLAVPTGQRDIRQLISS